MTEQEIRDANPNLAQCYDTIDADTDSMPDFSDVFNFQFETGLDDQGAVQCAIAINNRLGYLPHIGPSGSEEGHLSDLTIADNIIHDYQKS